MSIKPHTSCRACGVQAFEYFDPYLDLGTQAPANALLNVADVGRPEFTAPLSVSWCSACGLSQLDHVVDPKILYKDYPFRAGASQKWREHCVALVNTVAEKSPRGFFVDIGSNDGALLTEAHTRGFRVLGIDPSDTGNPKIPMLERFWNTPTAKEVTKCFRQADVITATNVFGHVDDAKDFLTGIALALKPDGKAIIECPHLIPLLDNTAFDTIYHEHLSYWSLRPLELLAESVGLKVIDVRLFEHLHGGTMRYILVPGDVRTKIGTRVARLRIHESALFAQGIAPYRDFAQRTSDRIGAFRSQLITARRAGSRIWGYGASAKGNVLLQAACLSDATMERIVDDCEPKWGYLSPGTHIPINNANDLSEPDILVLLSWNNAEDLKRKAQSRGFKGVFLLPHQMQLERAA